MTVSELIKALQKYPQNENVKLHILYLEGHGVFVDTHTNVNQLYEADGSLFLHGKWSNMESVASEEHAQQRRNA